MYDTCARFIAHCIAMVCVALTSLAASRSDAAVNAWTAMGPEGGSVKKVVFNPASPSTVYAIGGSGFFRSTDGGTTWQQTAAGQLNGFADLAFDPSNPSRVYVVGANSPPMLVSDDAGQTFATAAGYPVADSTYHLQVSHDGATVYAASTAHIYRSTDRGQSWQTRTPVIAGAPYGPVWQLLIDPNDANVLYATIYDSSTTLALFRSTDGAGTWQFLNSLPNTNSIFGFAITSDSSKLWAARNDGVWASTDRGQTWSNANFTNAAAAIALDPANSGVVYVADGAGHIYRSLNAGSTWSDITNNVSANLVNWIAVNPVQSAQILVAGLAGVSATSTSGSSWSPSVTGLIATRIDSFGVDPAADRIYAADQGTGVFYTTAGATRWTATNIAGLRQLATDPTDWVLYALHVQPGGRLFVALSGGAESVVRSIDGGADWSGLPFYIDTGNLSAEAFASSPTAPATILAAGQSGGLFRSVNGGDFWSPAMAGLPANALIGSVAGAVSDPDTFYAVVGDGSGHSWLYRSSDAGSTWSATTTTPTPNVGTFAIDPTAASTLYASTLAGFYRSDDGGGSWNALSWLAGHNETPFGFAIDPQHPRIVFAATVVSLARSIDSGASWQQLPQPANASTWSGALQLDPQRSSRLLAGTVASGSYEISIEPDLSIKATTPGDLLPLQLPSTFHYSISNQGPFHATDVALTLQLPATATASSATSSAGTCAASGSVLTCTLGDMLSGATATVDLTTTPGAAGSFAVTATVQGDQPDPNGSDNTVVSTGTAENLADLSITTSVPTSGTTGKTTTLTATVHNSGPNTAHNALLSFQLPATINATGVTSTAGSCTPGATVSCKLGDLASGASATVSVTAGFASAGNGAATASVSSDATDTNTSNNSANNTVSVTDPPAQTSSGGGGGGALDRLSLAVLALLWVMGSASWEARGRTRYLGVTPSTKKARVFAAPWRIGRIAL
jgi:photosystem II stability/assembly factor-like uncharacterized protein